MSVVQPQVRRTQGDIARRQRRLILWVVGLASGIAAVLAVVVILVPGVVTRDVVKRSVENALAVQVNSCTGPMTAMRCELQDGSGTPGSYRVSVAGSCWQAHSEQTPSGLETVSTGHACVSPRLWENIF